MGDGNTTEDRRQMPSSDNPWLSASSQHFHPLTRTVPDSFAPPAFNGTNIDADTWLAHFQRYAEYRQLADRDITQIFPLFLKDSAIDWYDTLTADMQNGLGKDDGSTDATEINQLTDEVRAGRDEVQQLNAMTQLNVTSHADAE